MATFDPETDVAAKIAADGHGTVGTTIFRGPVRAESASPSIPRNAIFVSAPTGGAAPVGVGGNPHRYRSPAVQIRVRHQVHDTGRDLARAIYDDLAAGTLTNYIHLAMNESGPMFIGQNENGAYEWSMNVTTIYDVTT